MPEWMAAILPFGLSVLKIVGVIGAFFGFAEARKTEAVRGKRLYLPALVFLFVAVVAEVYDAVIKQQDAREMAYRFERLIRPLGRVKISMGYILPLDAPELAPYRDQLVRWQKADDDSPFPIPKDRAAATLLGFFPQATIFFFRHPTSIVRREGRADIGGEPDMSIFPDEGRPPDVAADSPNIPTISRETLKQRTFNYRENGVEIRLGQSVDSPDDRYSNGEIVSLADLVGAQIIVRLAPFWLDPVIKDPSAAANAYRLSRLGLEFSGRQNINLDEKDFKREQGDRNFPSFYLYNLPKTKDDLYSKMRED
jgi:hypothetical protein